MAQPTANLQVEHVSVDALLLDPVNARVHPVRNLEAIQGSLARFGQQKPIVVGEDGVVVAGNGTLQRAIELEPKYVAGILERMARMGREGSRDGEGR